EREDVPGHRARKPVAGCVCSPLTLPLRAEPVMDALPAPLTFFLAPHPNPAGRARYGRATRAPNVLPRPSPWPCGPSPLWTRYPRLLIAPLKGRGKWPGYNRNRGVEQRQLVGLITRRSSVRIRPPQPL